MILFKRLAFLLVSLAGCTANPPALPASESSLPTAAISAKAAFEMDAEKPAAIGEKGLFVEEPLPPGGSRNTTAARASHPIQANIKTDEIRRRYRGLSYWIDRDRSGVLQRVTASSVFHGGDRVRIHVRSSLNGYLYAVAQGTSGNTRIIYPAGADQLMAVEANRTYTIPRNGAILFDNRPGDEVLWLFLTRRPLGETAAEPSRASGMPAALASAQTDCGTKDLLLVPDALDRDCGFRRTTGTKDLLVQDDTSSPEPAGYIVGDVEQLERGRLLSARLLLKHE